MIESILFYIELSLSVMGLLIATALFFYIIFDYKKKNIFDHNFYKKLGYCTRKREKNIDSPSGLMLGTGFLDERRKKRRSSSSLFEFLYFSRKDSSINI